MLRNLTITRPLVFFDLETTGTDTKAARIIEISLLKLAPGAEPDSHTLQLNPGVPIPAEATAVHGISDEDVADCPTFEEAAETILAYLDGCDISGFNVAKYDLRVLCAEFRRLGLSFPMAGRRIIDAQRIFHQREQRTLTAAMLFYCGKDHEDAHGAEADVRATVEVLDAQLDRYDDLPRTVDELHAALADPDAIDLEGNFKRVNGDVVFNFGKYQGKTLREIAADPQRYDYLQWMLKQDFFDDTKAIVREALRAS